MESIGKINKNIWVNILKDNDEKTICLAGTCWRRGEEMPHFTIQQANVSNKTNYEMYICNSSLIRLKLNGPVIKQIVR